ncbi:MAG: MBL fold metallo-hydrolase [Gemmatimonadetes bacterium]|nr:MBL fold metallo-hydrolase [Gemmatimonadota bacterium]
MPTLSRVALALAATLCPLAGVRAQPPVQGAAPRPAYTGPGFVRTEVAPGVLAFVFDNPLGDAANVDGTAVAIINETDVVVVDAQWTPATARRVIAELRTLTRKPVRYVITTHWHGDHWFGNQAYAEAYPGVEFVAHTNTAIDLETGEIADLEKSKGEAIDGAIRGLEQALASGKRRSGQPLTPADRDRLTRQIDAFRWALPAFAEIRPVRPTVTIADSLVLHRGARTIVVRYLGRGNTRGDLSVWLPNERVLVTGDLLVHPAPYAFGSFLGDWVATLGALRALPAAVIVPGHGAIQRDWRYLDLLVELLESTRAQARYRRGQGARPRGDTAGGGSCRVQGRFAQGDEAVGRAFDAFFIAPAVERAWREARGELAR